ncbi:Zinc finger, RING-type [Dillenia turbinata]|uniref:Zinc finger, RING-type n=1 Tax=Dillenia turbinata TaxID=194707 RepID=A0AAN8ZIA1_9MAGN
MGSSSSRLASHPPRSRYGRVRSSFSSFICGASSSSSRMEDHAVESIGNSTQPCIPVSNEFQHPGTELFSTSNSDAVSTSLETESGVSSETSAIADRDTSFACSFENVETSNPQGYSFKSKELVPSHQVSAECSHSDPSWQIGAAENSSLKEHQSSDLLNTGADMVAGNDLDGLVNGNECEVSMGVSHADGLSSHDLGNSCSNEVPVEILSAGRVSNDDSISDSAPINSVSQEASQSPGDESLREAITSGLGFLESDREQNWRDGSVLHVDMVSISSSILSRSTSDIRNQDARRNSGRLFWNAFSRRNSRIHMDSSAILFSNDDTGSMGLDRWFLDFNGDFFDNSIRGDNGFLHNRRHSTNERQRNSRSELWERLRSGLDEGDPQNINCPSGLHPDGRCSCDSFFMAEFSNTRASISRIVMLAEALFEVLDEIHRQSESLSLSMVSDPAPESVVESFPVKNHKSFQTANIDVIEQCYICLSEYEEGDKIRVLPCHHEYHMSCVDKWLKEIQGVCPLCRGDVRAGAADNSASSSEVPSMQ